MTGTPVERPVVRPVRLIGRGLTRRCAVCGAGGLFRGYFSMVERCPRCDFRFEREQGAFIGAVGINTIVTFTVLLVVVVTSFVATYPDGLAVALGIAVVAAVALPVVFYPFSKTLWVAIELAMRPLEPGEARPPWGQPE
jgi:uncharacterized protein (DUF983 family)